MAPALIYMLNKAERETLAITLFIHAVIYISSVESIKRACGWERLCYMCLFFIGRPFVLDL